MRGKVLKTMPKQKHCRITPAYAGKSRRCRKSVFLWRDHPRLCGEKNIGRLKRRMRQGSPPPMRGKGPWNFAAATISWITPAYAGKRR